MDTVAGIAVAAASDTQAQSREDPSRSIAASLYPLLLHYHWCDEAIMPPLQGSTCCSRSHTSPKAQRISARALPQFPCALLFKVPLWMHRCIHGRHSKNALLREKPTDNKKKLSSALSSLFAALPHHVAHSLPS